MQSKVYIRPHDLDLQLRTLQLKKEKSLSEIVDLLPQELLFSTEKEKEKKKHNNKRLLKSQIKCSYCRGQSGQANETEVQTGTERGKRTKKAILVDISVHSFP